MGILSGLREGLLALQALRRRPADGEPEEFAFSAEVPVTGADAPLWRIEVKIASEPHGDGEKIRVRAHIQTNLASALRPALKAPQAGGEHTALPSNSSGGMRLAQRAGALAQRTAARALQLPVLRDIAEPLLEHDLNTWIDVNASTAFLDKGSSELLPRSDKLDRLGIRPKAMKPGDKPTVETWAGEAPGGGFAQFSIVQMDKQHLPPQLADALGDKPFQLAAAIVNTAERK